MCHSPARSGPCAPGAPSPPHAPLPLIPLSHLIFSRGVTSLSLFHLSLSPRGALGFGDMIARVWIPGGEFFPSRSLLSLPPLPFFFPWPRARPSPTRASRPARAPALAACPYPGEPFGPVRPSPPRPAPRRRLGRARSCDRQALPARSRVRRAPPHAHPAQAAARPRRALPGEPPPRRPRAPRPDPAC
jgi:hypothetical protein